MNIFILILALLSILLYPSPVRAVCPLCTIAVAGGLGFSRWLGIDDSVTGIWIGGLILSSGLWLADWIHRKGWKLPYTKVFSTFIILLLVIPPLYWVQMIGLDNNTLWGVDKVLLGTGIGSVIFILAVLFDTFLRKTNEGKVYIHFQKVILPVFMLTLASFVLYIITS